MTTESSSHVLRYFEHDRLPASLRWISVSFRELAQDMARRLPDDPELAAGLRKLLEARDCAVRASWGTAADGQTSASPFDVPDGPVGDEVVNVSSLLNGKTHAPVVYFLRNGTRVKIGTTQNLRRRIDVLALRPDDLVRVEHGGQQHEQALHARFTAHRVSNTEWFELRGELADYVARRSTRQERIRNALSHYGEMRRRDLQALTGLTEKQVLSGLAALKPDVERTPQGIWRLTS
ncbi:GIY-YIG nuclease family protein [Streptomyces iakyrus]|uniref:GIY-YIG nuclease family protein n=1 Tax=Streptomyces iakyrus TaxID=68219 RepID=UPI0007C465B6|nr:GIY-YIG nuclease family protein [Streptomyces iakyrus]